MNRSVIVALIVISTAMGFTMWAFSSSMTPYVDIHQAEKLTGQVQIRGKIMHSTAHWSDRKHALVFMLKDKNNDLVEVDYHGAKPEAFDTAPETAAQGVLTKASDGKLILNSDSMVVKCPSKYSDKKGLKNDTSANSAEENRI